MASSPYRKDIVKEYTDAFRKNKLKVGLYYSIWDRRWDRDSSVDQVDAIKVQMKELLGGKYGTIDLLWLDGWGWQKRYSEIPYQEIREYIREISPSTVVSNNDHNYSLQTTDLLVWETAVKMPLPINAPGPSRWLSRLDALGSTVRVPSVKTSLRNTSNGSSIR